MALARRVLSHRTVGLVQLKSADRAGLTAALEAIERVERLGALRSLAVHALAVVGVALWVGVAFPACLPDALRRYALALFAALALAAAIALVLERRWLRIQRRLLDRHR